MAHRGRPISGIRAAGKGIRQETDEKKGKAVGSRRVSSERLKFCGTCVSSAVEPSISKAVD